MDCLYQGRNIYKRPIDKFGSASPLLVGRQQDAWILTVDPSGELLASGNPSGKSGIWPTGRAADRPLDHLDTEDAVNSLRFAPTGSLLVSGYVSGRVRLWDLAGPPALPPIELLGRSDVLKDSRFIRMGRWLATLGDFQKVGLWPLHRRYSRVLFRGTSRGAIRRGVAFAPDGSWVAASVEGARLRRWSLVGSGGEPIDAEYKPGVAMQAIAVDPAGRYILVGTFNGALLVPLREAGRRSSPASRTWFGPSPSVRRPPRGGRWGIYDRLPADRFIRVWDLESGTFRDLRTEQAIHYLTFLPDGRLLFASDPTEGQKSLYRWTIGSDRAELLKKTSARVHLRHER